MKYLITTITLFVCAIMYSQVGIGTSSLGTKVILDFQSGTTSAIILPRIDTPAGVAGTLLYDSTDKKVKYNNGGWVDLSIRTGEFTAVEKAERDQHTEVGDGAIIGAETTTAPGVLVLESSDKAMVLPKVASPHTSIISPEAGTICYDTTKKLFCVYNGLEWTFWGLDN